MVYDNTLQYYIIIPLYRDMIMVLRVGVRRGRGRLRRSVGAGDE